MAEDLNSIAEDRKDRFTWSQETPLIILPAGSAPLAIREAFQVLGGVQKNSSIYQWISERYPGMWEPRDIGSYLRRCSVNHPKAISYHPDSPRFLYNSAIGEFELYDLLKHGAFDKYGYQAGQSSESLEEEIAEFEASKEFALEAHLRDYLADNLSTLEKGLCLWSVDPPSVEYKVENRRIDLLAKDSTGTPVVIELKLSKSYDRVIGQALLYRALVCKLLGCKRVRLILVAGEVSNDLKLATSSIADVLLVEYSISFKTRIINNLDGAI